MTCHGYRCTCIRFTAGPNLGGWSHCETCGHSRACHKEDQ